jgi:hypothetical protein
MAKAVAHPAVQSQSLAKALDRAAQLLRGLEELGLSDEAIQLPIDHLDKRRELVVCWQGLAHPASAESSASCTLAEAAQIMGSNFHGPTDANKQFGIRMGQKVFRSVPFSAEALRACKDTHVLVATPGMSIMDIHGKASQKFCSKSNPWHGVEAQKFAQVKIVSGWYLIRKEAVPSSTSKMWANQLAMVKSPDFVPEANLAVYAYVIHFLVTGERLFRTLWVRTNSVTAGGDRVSLYGDADGLHVTDWYDDAHSSIGVAEARNF